jgi:pyruvate/2-oxoglutarate/acetoin dehydrogenase E1 component
MELAEMPAKYAAGICLRGLCHGPVNQNDKENQCDGKQSKAKSLGEPAPVDVVGRQRAVKPGKRAGGEPRPAIARETRILDLRTVVPWDKEAVMESVREIGRVLIVHEDTITTGFGGEIAAQIADEAFVYLDAPVKRVACADVPSPTHHNLFEAVMPTAAKIQAALEELARF